MTGRRIEVCFMVCWLAAATGCAAAVSGDGNANRDAAAGSGGSGGRGAISGGGGSGSGGGAGGSGGSSAAGGAGGGGGTGGASGGAGGAGGSGGSVARDGGGSEIGMLVPEGDGGGRNFGDPPSPWKGVDIGDVGAIKGRFGHQHNGLFVLGGGAGIGGAKDGLYMVYYPITGDGVFTIRNPGLSGPTAESKSGGMIRASLDADAAHIFVGFGGMTAGSAFQLVRTATGGNTTRTDYPGVNNNTAFKIVRAGNNFTLFRGSTMVTTATIAMPQTVYAGLVFSAGSPDKEGGATYGKDSSVSYGLPMGWQHDDVETNLGVAVYAGNVLTLTGYGTNFTNTDAAGAPARGEERFGWVYQAAPAGDYTLTAKVASMTGLSPNAKVGLMFREAGGGAASAHAMIAVGPEGGEGVVFRYRPASGMNVALGTPMAGLKPPLWLRISRSGSMITAKVSTNGTTWMPAGSADVTLTTASVGMLVNSGKYTVGSEGVNTAKFESITFAAGAQ